MAQFMSDKIFLTSETAERLYMKIRDLPIFDYHCHLNPQEIYENRKFENLGELWLEADHYKWRVMRNFGIDENLITGDADYKDKFFAFSKALPSFIGNPVYHWAHLELKKYFGITAPLSDKTAEEIWNKTFDMMKDGRFSARELIVSSNVDTVVTTDDPTSDLKFHKLLRKEEKRFKVLPCFRPDKAINIVANDFADYIRQLSCASGVEIKDVSTLQKALDKRLDFFLENGCTAADISFENFPDVPFDEEAAAMCLKDRLSGNAVSESNAECYKKVVIVSLMQLFKKKNIVLQIHTGVIRNQNTLRFKKLGADTGIDSIGNTLDIAAGGNLFDLVEQNGGLPKTIVYTLNPNSYYPLATMIGDFAGESKGKMQLGAAWWFMDHRDGIKEQLKVFANTSGLGLFNGMLTDSRSFVSYARHDYFRRILCSLLAEWADAGEYPVEDLEELLKNIAYYNAKNFFGGKQ